MKKLSILTALFLSVQLFAQSPWTKKINEGYVQLNFTTVASYDKVFGSPDYDTQRQITDNTLQLYGEFGITNNTTIFANVPLKMLKSGNFSKDMTLVLPIFTTTKATETTLGNIQFGVKHNFINNKWLVSVQVAVEANTSSYNANAGLRSGYDAWTVTPLILTGRSFDKWYIQAFTGVDIRTNNYSSNFKLGGEIGYKTLDWLWIAGFLDGVASLKNGDIALPQENLATALYVNDQSYAAFGLKFIAEFNKKIGANIGLGGAFAGKNVAKVPAISVGLYHKF